MSRGTITHIGGPTALIEVGGWRLLTDPTFDSPRQALLLRLGHPVAQACRARDRSG
jgi:L-ascorbate metabolism protein UlaG (beta-lactamase superfamily)